LNGQKCSRDIIGPFFYKFIARSYYT